MKHQAEVQAEVQAELRAQQGSVPLEKQIAEERSNQKATQKAKQRPKEETVRIARENICKGPVLAEDGFPDEVNPQTPSRSTE